MVILRVRTEYSQHPYHRPVNDDYKPQNDIAKKEPDMCNSILSQTSTVHITFGDITDTSDYTKKKYMQSEMILQ